MSKVFFYILSLKNLIFQRSLKVKDFFFSESYEIYILEISVKIAFLYWKIYEGLSEKVFY